MANPEHLAKLREGPGAWNRWREEHADVVLELSHAKLPGANLGMANLRGADLRRSFLGGGNFMAANFVGADLSGANFIRADFQLANLGGANFIGADLRKANLDKATLLNTIFGDTDLSEAMGLDTCGHLGPSTVDHRTLGKSGLSPSRFSEVVAFLTYLTTTCRHS